MAATLPLLAGALTLGITDASADSATGGRDALQGTKPAWATATADQGATADSGKVAVRVHLAGRDAKGLRPTRPPCPTRSRRRTGSI